MKPQRWSDEFIKNMLAKGSIHPPPEGYSVWDRMPGGLFWVGFGLTAAAVIVVLAALR
jgi:hypothetical protein